MENTREEGGGGRGGFCLAACGRLAVDTMSDEPPAAVGRAADAHAGPGGVAAGASASGELVGLELEDEAAEALSSRSAGLPAPVEAVAAELAARV